MNLDQITTKCFILALFIRDDGQRLLLGDGYYDFNQKLQHFQANTIANDVVELQGDNGQLLAGQVMRSGAQKFEGYIGDATTNRQTIEQKRSDFMAFFRIKHFYQVIYILPDGTAIQRRRGYLTDAPAVPEIFQKFPEYHIALNFEDANYYEYAEDEHGDEIYAHIIELALSGNATGGLVWDAIGAVTNGISWSNIQTAQGEYISITNALDIPAKLASVEMLGNAEQDGTPTPDSPVAVQTVTGEQVIKNEGSDDSQEFEVNLGKNLFSISQDTIITNAYLTNNTTLTFDNLNSVKFVATGTQGAQYLYRIISGLDSAKSYTLSFKAIKNVKGSTGLPYIRITTYGSNDGSTWTNLGVSGESNPTEGETYSFAKTLTGYSQYRFMIFNNVDTPVQIGETTTFFDIQLEEGAQTSFAPYFTPIELCKIGTYQDRIYKSDGKWYIEKQVGKVVLDGSESWTKNTSSLGLYYQIGFSGAVATTGSPASEALCDHFVARSRWYVLNANDLSIGLSTTTMSISYNAITSLSEWTTWLSTHPTTVYYALATPTTTEITNEALIAQLDALGASSLFVGVNNIGTETLNAVPTLKIEYYTEYTLEGAGYEWEPGGNTAKTIVTVAGVDSAWPIWTVQGGAQNPTLTNITTGQTITWQGFVPEGQTLTINMAEMTADLAGANVFEYITGEWIRLAPGNNTLVYTAGSADKPSTLSWNGVLA